MSVNELKGACMSLNELKSSKASLNAVMYLGHFGNWYTGLCIYKSSKTFVEIKSKAKN